MIRGAVEADLVALLDLETQAFGPDAWSTASLRTELDHADRIVLVDERDGTVVGYVDVGVVADVADLHRVVVADARRREGVASALLAAGLDAAVAGGAERMLLEVADDNAPALALYAAHGFVSISRRHGYYAAGRDALVLEKALEKAHEAGPDAGEPPR